LEYGWTSNGYWRAAREAGIENRHAKRANKGGRSATPRGVEGSYGLDRPPPPRRPRDPRGLPRPPRREVPQRRELRPQLRRGRAQPP
ncbi:hypothetical protein ELE48_28575, partial [Klebsiella pneumoniae]|nr:hypothetical protein [Klebsiella pneumoniae]